ncbi:uncharacterized protein [Euphorbia lathyris]|uniref:uncharacterized protein n=1 Tax=Euphorbia lathyris TaxID=212925 RepID=UPI0033142B46
MEGAVSEEPKSYELMERGADSSQGEISGRIKRKRVNKKLRDSSSQVKRKRVKKERLPWVQRGIDASQGEMAGGSEHHQIKCKRVKKKRVSRMQRGTDASQGGSKRHQVKTKRVEKDLNIMWQRSIAANEGKMDRVEPFPFYRFKNKVVDARLMEVIKSVDLMYAKKALEFYEKSQDADFEILEVFNAQRSMLIHPEYKRSQEWCHVSFIAKPKNADCSDVSPKHLFAELLQRDYSSKWDAIYCCTFEPSDDPGFNHGCIFCPAGEKFHPANGYRVGRPPWTEAGVIWV